ncbi:MAG: hypothetical protein HY896_13980 [Deltaproteobacteria bacterium]|nr:hypothetical protein [Deltaproteobacteria bacterium]
MRKIFVAAGIMLAMSLSGGTADAAGPSHAGYVKTFEGPRTCTAASCHPDAAKEVAESLHYQQRAVPQFLEGWESGKLAGMTETY